MSKADKRARQKERARQAHEERLRAEKRARQRKTAVRVALVVALFAAALIWLRAANDDDKAASTTSTTADPYPEGCTAETPEANPDAVRAYDAAPEMQIDPAKLYTAKISTSCGDITVLLDPENAPTATNNFVFLARQGFYDGLSFHRIAADFVVQGGDPNGDGTGGPGYSVAGEVPADGTYPYGSLAAAKGGAEPAGTMGSQFFIVTAKEANGLTPDYARFGLVTDGLEALDTLASLYNPDQNPADPSTQTTAVPLYIFSVEIEEIDPATTTTGPDATTTTAPAETTVPGETTPTT